MKQTPKQLWDKFIKEFPEYANEPMPAVDHFCNNEKDANECAKLVVEGKKIGTCGALISYEKSNTSIPKIGDLWIITDWDKNAVCIIKTTQIEPKKFSEIDKKWAETEGEGDLSLAYWKRVHWDFFTKELQQYNEKPSEDMVLICETFEKIF